MTAHNPFEPPKSAVENPRPSNEADATPTQRPAAIELAFRLILGSAALGVVSFLARGQYESVATLLVVLVILLGLAFLIRAGKNWARIIYLVLVLLGLPALLSTAQLIAQYGMLFFSVFCLQSLLQGIAVWLTLRPPGSHWFKRRLRAEA